MSRPVSIPEKLFFKIGEVCELAGVQAHVLRYWESEFPMLAPQKNRAGQRVYRKRDVEMALRIKELLYEDQYTIAGAKKRLTNELRGGGKLKLGGEDGVTHDSAPANGSPLENDASVNDGSGANAAGTNAANGNAAGANGSLAPSDGYTAPAAYRSSVAPLAAEERRALKQFAAELRDLLSLLEQETQNRTK
ncbi:MAG TPA: MerR family transcriptional regulator [Pyrinomonadaceae bacterium]|jgi:DNA-binding transcriptional MerR regulator|nr:MerR family transcriptional regulator [Pyrinomonadaceae bacterium]